MWRRRLQFSSPHGVLEVLEGAEEDECERDCAAASVKIDSKLVRVSANDVR